VESRERMKINKDEHDKWKKKTDASKDGGKEMKV